MIYRFTTISVKILVDIFVKIEKVILKFPWKCKLPRIAKIILKTAKLDDLL